MPQPERFLHVALGLFGLSLLGEAVRVYSPAGSPARAVLLLLGFGAGVLSAQYLDPT